MITQIKSSKILMGARERAVIANDGIADTKNVI